MTGTVLIANGGTGATTAATARSNLSAAQSGANTDITSLIGLTGAISSPTYMQFGSGSGTTLAAGRMWYDNTTGSLNFGMGNGNITQQVGEELFIYGKASAAITESPLQIVYHTGTVGASGTLTFAPTVSGITDVNAILGVATENIALNGFGRITTYGIVHGITTNGTAFGETWADDDVIWYNPVTGNPTKVEPVAPYIKVQIGLVINAGSSGSGSFQVAISRGSKLGSTDSNVQFGTLANNNLIAYDSTLGYWKNVTSSSLSLGTVTSVAATVPSFLSVAGSPITTSGTLAISLSGTALPIANGGTGQTSATAAFDALAPSQTSNSGKYLTTNGTTTSWATVSGSGATITNDTTTSTNVYPLFAAATSGSLTTAYTSNANYLYKPSTGELQAPAAINTNGIAVMSTTVSTSYTIATGNNGFSVGPLTVNSGVTVTISSGQRHVII